MNRFKLTNVLLFLLSVLALVGLVLPYSTLLFSGNSFYFHPIDLIRCKNEESCRHELAHLIDHDNGDISKTEAFSSAILMTMYYQMRFDVIDDYGKTIISSPGIWSYSKDFQPFGLEAGSSPQQELYANLYALAEGDVNSLPNEFKPLYLDDDKYDEIYQFLIDHHFYVKGAVQMKEQALALWAKVQANKAVVIQVGSILVGAALGAVVAAVVNAAQEETLIEEVGMEMLDEEETEE